MYNRLSILFVRVIFLLLLALILNSCKQTLTISPFSEAPGPDFVALFNGKDFTGWNIEPDSGAWVVEDGMIRCKGFPLVPYLIQTMKEYENFDFYAEFNIVPGCNSGIFFHVPPIVAGRSSRLGFEVQIIYDAGKVPTKTSTGSIYDQIPPRINAMKPAGEWNQYRVLFDWPICKVWLNGKLIQDAAFSQYPHLKYRLRRGIIGLSNHGHGIRYRNLWIKELPDKEFWQMLFNGKNLTGWQIIGDADWHLEAGAVVATAGEGYLVTEDEFQDFHFQAYIEQDTLQTRAGCFYYRWKSQKDPGYSAEFYDYPKAVRYLAQYGFSIPENVIPAWNEPECLLYQIISTDRESEVRTGGYITSKNYLLQKVRPGKIAIYHSPEDGVLKIHQIRIKKLDGMGI